MITIPDQIKQDLSNDIDNFSILLAITSIDGGSFFISTREGNYSTSQNGTQYYEDLGLDVKGLKESIDIKSKKVKMSSGNITISNYKPSVDMDRFSDRVEGSLLNATVRISLATSQGNSVDLALLKVTRYSHDDKAATLQCDDFASDALSQELPHKDYTLYEGTNTYEVYNEERVPILYGHLKEAPAITYIDDENKIKVIADRTYFNNGNIAGIKQMLDLPDFTHDSYTDRQASILPDQDILTVKLGDAGARVYRVVPRQLNGRLLADDNNKLNVNLGWEKQFDIYNNYIEFYTDESVEASELINQGALMVGELSNLEKASTYYTAYSVHQSQGEVGSTHYQRYPMLERSNEEDMDLFSQASCYLTDTSYDGGDHEIPSAIRAVIGGTAETAVVSGSDITHFVIRIPSMVFEFEELACDADVWKDPFGREAPSDFHLIGGYKIQMIPVAASRFDLHLNFFPGKADFTYGIESWYTDGSEYWQSSQPIALIDKIISGGTNDISDDEIQGLNDAEDLEEHSKALNAMCPYRFEFENVPVDETGVLTDYRHSFNIPNNGASDQETNQWRLRGDFIEQYPTHDVKSLVMNVNPTVSGTAASDELNIHIYGEFSGMQLKRTWYQAEAFNNKFFLNAKGKYNPYFPNGKTYKISNLQLQYRSENKQCGGQNPSHRQEYDDLVLMFLLDYLTKDRLRYKMIDGKKHELMIQFEHGYSSIESFGEVNYLFDLELSNMEHSLNADNFVDYKLYLNGNLFRDSVEGDYTDDFIFYGKEIKLVYARKVQTSAAIPTLNSIDVGEEIEGFADALSSIDEISTNIGDQTHLEIIAREENISSGAKSLLTRPSSVLQDLILTEIPSINSALQSKNIDDYRYSFDFSINKKEKVADILQRIASNANFFYKTSLSNSAPTAIGFLDYESNPDKSINVDYITKISFDRSKIEDVALRTRVKYGYDYIKEEYTKTTPDRSHDGVDEDGNLLVGDYATHYLNYYGISNEAAKSDTYLIEHEAQYIQDESTALRLRDELFNLHKNQHLIIKFRTNLSNGFELEVGDNIEFVDSSGNRANPLGVKPYGLDITVDQYLPYPSNTDEEWQQKIFPQFMITSMSKSLNGVDIECMQINHAPETASVPDDPEIEVTPGDVDNDGVANTIADYELLRSFLLGNEDLNDIEFLNADVNQDSYVDNDDLLAMLPAPTILGDVTGDGTGSNYLSITQDDVDLAQAYLDGDETLTFQQIANGDLNNDGMITEDDITLLEELIASLQPPSPDSVGELLIDTHSLSGDDLSYIVCGVIRIGYDTINNEINIQILRDTPIDETGQSIEELYNSWVNSGVSIVDTVMTFIPMLLQEPWLSESQIWYNATGDYLVNSIEKILAFPEVHDEWNYYEIRLDALSNPNFDEGWNLDALTLQDLNGAYLEGENSGIGVTLYGQAINPEPPFEPFEMMSTQNDWNDPNGGIYDFSATHAGSIRVYIHNGTQVTWNDHYLGSSFYSKTWLDFKGITNDNSDEYSLTGVRVRTHCSIRNQDNYNELQEGSQAKTHHDNLMTLFDGTSWQLKVTGLYITSSTKTAIVIDGDTGIDVNGDAILRNGTVYEIQGESIETIGGTSEDILDFGFSIEYEFWEED
tara:strand:+ start:6328 stop:11178 length:4851 start_codon:yes stop_codon:yes gene_type:complete